MSSSIHIVDVADHDVALPEQARLRSPLFHAHVHSALQPGTRLALNAASTPTRRSPSTGGDGLPQRPDDLRRHQGLSASRRPHQPVPPAVQCRALQRVGAAHGHAERRCDPARRGHGNPGGARSPLGAGPRRHGAVHPPGDDRHGQRPSRCAPAASTCTTSSCRRSRPISPPASRRSRYTRPTTTCAPCVAAPAKPRRPATTPVRSPPPKWRWPRATSRCCGWTASSAATSTRSAP